MVTLHGKLFSSTDCFLHNLNHFWGSLQDFFYNHKTLYEILFLLVYFLEQLILFVLILLYPIHASVFAGVFSLILITTISFEKICMESRYKLLQQHNIVTEMNMENLEKQYHAIYQENENMRKVLDSKSTKRS